MAIAAPGLVRRWLAILAESRTHKAEAFQDVADEAYRFYSRPNHLFMFEEDDARPSSFQTGGFFEGEYKPISGGEAQCRFSVNKVGQLVDVYTPWIYHRNPTRNVKPRKVRTPPPEMFGLGLYPPGTPQAVMAEQQWLMAEQANVVLNQKREFRAKLIEDVLNYTPKELDLKGESRLAVIEAIVKGRGVLWPSLYRPSSGASPLPGSFYDTVDNLFVDSDCENLRRAKWIARRCVSPIWELEREFPKAAGKIKANRESRLQAAGASGDAFGMHSRKIGATADSVVYWRIWSRMGIGARLKASPDMPDSMAMDGFGDYVHLVIAEGTEYPLNLTEEMLWNAMLTGDQREIVNATSWPVPFFLDDSHPWPVAEFDPLRDPRNSWPQSLTGRSLGYQRFLNWAMSWIAGKMKRSVRDILAYPNELAKELEEVLRSPRDFEVIGLNLKPSEMHMAEKIVQFIQQPMIKGDIFQVVEYVEREFERATGMSELLTSGQTQHQFRSAEEAAVKGEMAKARPEDIANTADDWMGLVARKEAIVAQYWLKGQDVQPVLGDAGARAWDQIVASGDFQGITREFDYQIESGSSRRPNKDLEIANSESASQYVLPSAQALYQQTGDPTQINAFFEWWCEARQIDPTKWKLPDMRQQMQQQEQIANDQEQQKIDTAKDKAKQKPAGKKAA